MHKKRWLILIISCFSWFGDAVTEWDGVYNPRVSIITSIYDGDRFIEDFLADIVQQTIFHQCELILINANSPGNEYEVIKPYLEQYPNIFYERLQEDPGIYAVWNYAIKSARSPYITNANLDDRVHHACYEVHAQVLDEHPEVDLVYSDVYIDYTYVKSFDTAIKKKRSTLPEFSLDNMRACLPNDHPMWRKSMHEKYGYFDESYVSAGDYDMWLRAVEGGVQFKKACDEPLGIHYANPKGLSTNLRDRRIRSEVHYVYKQYAHLWPPKKKIITQ